MTRRAPRTSLFRMFLAEKRDPEPFYRQLAIEAIDLLPDHPSGQRILDLGSGPGYYSVALRDAGATVVAVDQGGDDVAAALAAGVPAAAADAARLPIPAASFDGVLCSNMLEHTPDVGAVFDEIARVVRPGGWAWVSWTNWYSPWGGHAITPMHYLGPRLGLRAYRRVFGEPTGTNLPFVSLWPTHIGATMRLVEAHPALDLVDARPRYYPSQRWIVKVPGLREVATWNCLLVLRRRF